MKKQYGQADYCYAISRMIIDELAKNGLITEEQKYKIDELNRKTIFARYSSIADLEIGA